MFFDWKGLLNRETLMDYMTEQGQIIQYYFTQRPMFMVASNMESTVHSDRIG